MKEFILAIVGIVILAGCGEDKGSEFVGSWKTINEKFEEVLTAEKTPSGYRVNSTVEKFGSGFDLEVVLLAESDTLLVRQGNQKKGLELTESGEIVSYLRGKDKKMVRAN